MRPGYEQKNETGRKRVVYTQGISRGSHADLARISRGSNADLTRIELGRGDAPHPNFSSCFPPALSNACAAIELVQPKMSTRVVVKTKGQFSPKRWPPEYYAFIAYFPLTRWGLAVMTSAKTLQNVRPRIIPESCAPRVIRASVAATVR